MLIYTLVLISLCSLTEATIPVYYKCHGTITLNEVQPVAKLYISFQDTFYRSYFLLGQLAVRHFCSVQIERSTRDYTLGVLLIGNPKLPRSCIDPYFGRHTCRSCNGTSLKIQKPSGYVWNEYCGFQGVEHGKIADAGFSADSLNISWTLGNSGGDYEIILYSFSRDVSCPVTRLCKYGPRPRRCIPDKLICESPFEFCGDGSSLCHNASTTAATVGHDHTTDVTNDHTVGTTREINIALYIFIGIGGFIIMLLFVCFCKLLAKWTRNAPRNAPVSNEQQISNIQMIDIQPEYVDNTNVSASNAGVSDEPPLYDSLVTHEGDSVKDDLPPSYHIAMSHAQDYKIDTSVNTQV